MENVIIFFIDKMKTVLNLMSDEEMDEFNNIYNDRSTEELITWINQKYDKYINIIDRLNNIPN